MLGFRRRRLFFFPLIGLFGVVNFVSYHYYVSPQLQAHRNNLKQSGDYLFEPQQHHGQQLLNDLNLQPARRKIFRQDGSTLGAKVDPPSSSTQKLLLQPRSEEADIYDLQNNLLVQHNPWLPRASKDAEDPLSSEKYSSQKVGGCDFRQFSNHSVYSKVDFVHEYLAYQKCMRSQPAAKATEDPLVDAENWTQNRISAETGPKGELRLRTGVEFGINVDKKRRRGREEDGHFCDKAVANQTVVLYVVFSAPDSDGASRRNAIRKTWGSRMEDGHDLIFLLSKGDGDQSKLRAESMLHNDIVSSEVRSQDPYFPFKQTVAMLAWAYEYCEPVHFVAKLTDKTFVNVKRFQLLATQEASAANRIYGTLLRRREPDRDPAGEHFVSEEHWPWKYFPPFIQGPSYVLSGDVVPRLLVAAKFTPILTLNQVFFTGLAPLVNHIMRIGVNSFFHPSTEDLVQEYESNECAFAKHGAINEIAGGLKEMEVIWQDVTTLQDDRNITCTIKPPCLARIDGKCMLYSSDERKRKKKKKFELN